MLFKRVMFTFLGIRISEWDALCALGKSRMLSPVGVIQSVRKKIRYKKQKALYV